MVPILGSSPTEIVISHHLHGALYIPGTFFLFGNSNFKIMMASQPTPPPHVPLQEITPC